MEIVLSQERALFSWKRSFNKWEETWYLRFLSALEESISYFHVSGTPFSSSEMARTVNNLTASCDLPSDGSQLHWARNQHLTEVGSSIQAQSLMNPQDIHPADPEMPKAIGILTAFSTLQHLRKGNWYPILIFWTRMETWLTLCKQSGNPLDGAIMWLQNIYHRESPGMWCSQIVSSLWAMKPELEKQLKWGGHINRISSSKNAKLGDKRAMRGDNKIRSFKQYPYVERSGTELRKRLHRVPWREAENKNQHSHTPSKNKNVYDKNIGLDKS